jgi:hypothetical protein
MAKADLEDLTVIVEELNRFGRMSFEDLKEHWNEYREDIMPGLALPDRNHRPIGRKAAHYFGYRILCLNNTATHA